MTPDADSLPTDVVVVRRLRRLTCVFAGLLVFATWPLWIPGPELPEIPWSESWCFLPESFFDWTLLAGAALWLVLEFVGLDRRSCRTWIIRGILAGPWMILLVLDQHRLQPWVMQMLMLAAILSVADARTGLRCARLLVISIYIHSALSKIDVAFINSHGQFLLDGLTKSLGVSTEFWSATTKRVLAGTFPVGELLTGIFLLWPRTRRIGLTLAIMMHVMLLLTLGPLGHAHHWGVLVWNVYFILMDLLIFRASVPVEKDRIELPARNSSILSPDFSEKAGNVIAYAGTALFAILPCLSWWGYWDHWPSWAVYSSRPAIVEVSVPEGDIERLPQSLQPFIGSPQPLSDLCPVNLDAWSFETLWCPMYPQERYRLAVALALGERSGIDSMRVIVRSSPDRWTGERQETTLDGLPAIRSRAEKFWINTRSRQ
ncbi:MAG: hypothetical protein KDA52_10990 [Planctomycetaceae bacterium]|nr:hypothetical protein [Planctomycetaceae bacterium]